MIAAFSGSAALANGFTAPPPEPTPYTPSAPTFDWGGFYGGVSIGYGSTNYNASGSLDTFIDNQDPAGPPIPLSLGLELPDLGGLGPLGGVHLGYNFMFSDNIVAGIQLDASLTAINNTTSAYFEAGPVDDDYLSFEADYEIAPRTMYTVAGRLGFLPNPDTMVYGLLGYTRASYRGSLSISAQDGVDNPPMTMEDDYTFDLNGVAIGFGIETRVGRNTTLGLEYRYNHMRRYSFIDEQFGDESIEVGFDPTVQTVRATLNYHF